MKSKFATEEWLKESIAAGKLLDTAGYELGIFEGLNIGVLGFTSEEFKEIVR